MFNWLIFILWKNRQLIKWFFYDIIIRITHKRVVLKLNNPFAYVYNRRDTMDNQKFQYTMSRMTSYGLFELKSELVIDGKSFLDYAIERFEKGTNFVELSTELSIKAKELGMETVTLYLGTNHWLITIDR